MNNPPAFPNVNINLKERIEVWGESGMTLRDYFAAKAMQGAISGCAARGEVIMYSELAGLSYEVADSMLKAREQ